MRGKIATLEEAFTGHHAFLWDKMLARIDAIAADRAELDTKLEELGAPVVSVIERLDEIAGSGPSPLRSSWRSPGSPGPGFPRPPGLRGQVRPWGGESVGKKKGRHERHRARQPVPGPGPGPGRDRHRLHRHLRGERYRRLARHRGTKKALVAVGRCLVVILGQVLCDPQALLKIPFRRPHGVQG